MINSKSKAFTIIELIMTIVVIGALTWIGIAAMLSGVDTWGFFTQRKDLVTDGRMAMDRMLREIRMVKNLTSVTTADSTTFRFTNTNDNDITYTISSGIINRTENGTTNGLLGNVTGLTFTYYTTDGLTPIYGAGAETNIRRIRIAIALSKGTSRVVNLQSDVWPRNLK